MKNNENIFFVNKQIIYSFFLLYLNIWLIVLGSYVSIGLIIKFRNMFVKDREDIGPPLKGAPIDHPVKAWKQERKGKMTTPRLMDQD